METNVETISAIVVAALAFAPLAWRARKASSRWVRASAPVLLVILPGGTGWAVSGLLDEVSLPLAATDRPTQVADAGYISSDARSS